MTAYAYIDHADFTGEGIDDYVMHGTITSRIMTAIAPESELLNAKVIDRNGDVDEIEAFHDGSRSLFAVAAEPAAYR